MISAHDVRSLRARLDLTQAELAHRLGVSPRSIVSWEANGVPDRSEARVRARLEAPAVPEALAAPAPGAAVAGTVSLSLLHGIPRGRLLETAFALRGFSTEDLLHELLRRAADRAPAADVGGAPQTEDLHSVDLRTEYGLAASHDDTGVDPTRGEA